MIHIITGIADQLSWFQWVSLDVEISREDSNRDKSCEKMKRCARCKRALLRWDDQHQLDWVGIVNV